MGRNREDGEGVFTRRGITLTELMITIAIVAVLAATVVPNFGKWIQHYRLRGTVREIVSQMELAKIRALKNNLEYRLVFKETNRSFRLERGDRPTGSSTWSQEGREFSLPKDVHFAKITFLKPDDGEEDEKAAEFNPHGTASRGSAILATSHNEKYTITVTTATGRIKTFVGEVE